MKIFGINKTRTTNLHPQSNGMVERFKKTILDYLLKFFEEDQHNWDRKDHLYTPTMLIFEQKTKFSADVILGSNPPDNDDQELSQYVIDLQRCLRDLHEVKRENLRTISKRMKAKYVLPASGPSA